MGTKIAVTVCALLAALCVGGAPATRSVSNTVLLNDTNVNVNEKVFDASEYGLIGVLVEDLPNKLNLSTFPNTTGDCEWRGHAPFCGDGRYCPSEEYISLRESNTAYHFENDSTEWDETFGKPCWNWSKMFCCRPGKEDATWAGTWRNILTTRFMQCTYKAVRPCGEISCTENGHNYTSPIMTGCVTVIFNGKIGQAEPGILKIGTQFYYKVKLQEL